LKERGKEKKISVYLMGKSLTLIFLVTIALVTPLMNIGAAQGPTRLYVNPPSIFDTTKTTGTSFSVDVNVENVVDLYTWALELHWDPDVLNVTSVVEGPFLAEVAPEGTFFIDKRYQDAGWIDEACSILGPYLGAEGNGTLLTVTFSVEKVGETTLHLSTTQLIDSKIVQIPHTADDGYFSNLPPSVDVSPSRSSQQPAESFSINITVSRMPDLYSWEFTLMWNATLLNATSVTEGPFLKSGGGSTNPYNETDNDVGRIYANNTLLGIVPGVSGAGTLVTITFLVKTTGGTTLDLQNTKLLNSTGGEIQHIAGDGQFSNKPPMAGFVILTASEQRMVNKAIAFDALSTICYDPDGYIVSYKWEFGDGNSTTKTAPDTSASNIYKWAGIFNVNLTVTDNDGLTGTIINPVTIKINSTITISVSPKTITFGQSLNISGSITPKPKAGSLVTIFHNKTTKTGQIYVNLTAVPTDQNGNYTYTWAPTTAGQIRFYASWKGDEITLPAGDDKKGPFASATVNKLGSSISMSVSPTTITYGGNLTISGSITPTKKQTPVTIWYNTTATAWNNITAVKTNDNSEYSYVWGPPTAGTFEIKANWTGDATTAGAESSPVPVTVNKAASSVSISVSPATPTFGQNITLTGTINPIRSNASVTIWYRRIGQTWTNMTTAKTNDTSQYTYTWTPPAATTFEMKANWTGDTNTNPAESPTTTVTINKASSTISIYLSATTIKKGESITIKGAISPKRINVQVQILVTTPGGMPLRELAKVTTDANGNYTYTYTPDISGTYKYQSKWEGDSDYKEDESDLATLTVQEEGAALGGGLDISLIAAAVGIIILLAIIVVFMRRRKSATPQP